MKAERAKLSSARPLPLHDLNATVRQAALPFEIHPFSQDNVLARADFPHRHSFYQILHVTAGSGTHVIDFEPYVIQPVVLYFISPGQVHFWRADVAPQGHIILFSGDFLLFDALDPAGFNKLGFFHSLGQTPQLALTASQAEPIAALLQFMEQEFQSPDVQASVLSAYLHILLAKIQRLYAASGVPAGRANDSALARRFQQLVSEQCVTQRSVRAYADQIGLSAGHLTELVKTATGQTPGQIIRQALALEAKRLLASTALTVEQISYRLAFNDPAYFGRLFRKETGTSPGRFRQHIREKYQIIQP